MSMKRISSYFNITSKKSKPNFPLEEDQNTIDGTSTGTTELISIQKPEAEVGESIQSEITDELDIANFTCRSKMVSDYIKSIILKRSNIPSSKFQYPFSLHSKKGNEEKRFLRKNHFEKYPWVEYSNLKHGLFCKICVLFLTSTKVGMHRTEQITKLVTEPINKFAKLLGKDGVLEVHHNNGYHKDNAQKAIDFLSTYDKPKNEIINLLNDQRSKEVLENRERLRPIIKTILLLGRQNIPLRGHRDDGSLVCQTEEEDKVNSIVNQGNFRELLKFRIDAGDQLLETHLKTTGSRATYISKLTQNEIIECCKQEILDFILLEIKKADIFSVLFDETTDISNISQMCLIIRYVLNNIIYEQFLSFVDCHNYIYKKNKDDVSNIEDNVEPKITGENLGDTVVKILQELGLNLDNCVGIGTDGCSVMVSEVRGAVQQIKKYAKNAIHSPCSNHALNLSIAKSSAVQSVRNCVGIIKEVVSFFHVSAKRNYTLKQHLTTHKKLHSLCETRWVERHDSIMQFKESIIEIVDTLTDVSEWNENITSSKAKMMIAAICNCEFIISIFSLSSLLAVTFPISKILQGKDQDIISASECIKDIYTILERNRKECEDKFKLLFKECEPISKDLNVDMRLPRITSRQKHRPTLLPSNNIVDYYRVNMYIPLLDNILEDLNFRFLNKENKNIVSLMQLTPKYLIKIKNEDLHNYLLTIFEIMTGNYTYFQASSKDIIQNELDLWFTKWKRHESEGKYTYLKFYI